MPRFFSPAHGNTSVVQRSAALAHGHHPGPSLAWLEHEVQKQMCLLSDDPACPAHLILLYLLALIGYLLYHTARRAPSAAPA